MTMELNAVYPTATDRHYWRLAYQDGATFDEPRGGGSIKNTPPEASILCVMKQGRPQPLWSVPIPPGSRPVWYRCRSLDVTFNSKSEGPAKLQATVFGFVDAVDSHINDEGQIDLTFDGKLWMLMGDQAVNVPERYFDHTAITSCYNRS
jgi:hypothetical protein